MRVFDAMARAIGVAQGTALIGIVLLILMSVMLRNFFDFGLVWVFEAAGFLMVTMVFLGAAKNAHEDTDVRVDVVTSRVSLPIRKALWLLRTSIVLCVSALLSWTLFAHFRRALWLATPTLEIPYPVFYFAVIVGPGLAALVAAAQLVSFLRGGIPDDRL